MFSQVVGRLGLGKYDFCEGQAGGTFQLGQWDDSPPTIRALQRNGNKGYMLNRNN